jgi:DNA-binding PadR family transcriptional regulator
MKYVILKLLRDKAMHGYEVMKALEEQSHGCYKPSPGTVYPTLQWLEDEGLVRSEEREGKKVYAITDEGRKFLEEHKSTVEDIFERLEEMVDDLVGDPMPDVIREVGKLVGQVYRTAWRRRDDDEIRRQIVEALRRTREEISNLGREAKPAEASGPAEASDAS